MTASWLLRPISSYILLRSPALPQICLQALSPISKRTMATTTSSSSDDASGATTTTTASIAPSPSPTMASASSPAYVPRFVDIGINLTDKTYRGIYHGRQRHEDDLDDVIQRAVDAGVKKMMATGSDLEGSKEAIKIAEQYPGLVYATVGVHPCSAQQIENHLGGPQAYLSNLESLALSGKSKGVVTAFGEIGLDYDRLYLCPKEIQLTHFKTQLDISLKLGLPLFLHSRAAAEDFASILFPHLPNLPGGLVHSFTGTVQEMKQLIDVGLYIGINGCSLKTKENLAVVREIPLDKIMIETDGPWCEMRPSQASFKVLEEMNKKAAKETRDQGGEIPPPEIPRGKKKEKWEKGQRVSGRNEPSAISSVAWVVAGVKGVSVETVCEAAWRNSIKLFGLGEQVEGKIDVT